MLFALTSPYPSLALPDFNKWYDERHAPSRAACPGVLAVSRYLLDDDDARNSKRVGHWTWLAVYELEEEANLHTEEYKNARKNDGDDESKMFDFLSRRVYRLIEDQRSADYSTAVSSGNSRLMVVVGSKAGDAVGSTSQDLLERYGAASGADRPRDEGWLRSSFWRLSAATDPRNGQEQTDTPDLLALHEWVDSDTTRESDAVQKLLAPPAKGTAGDSAQVVEKAVLRLWKQF